MTHTKTETLEERYNRRIAEAVSAGKHLKEAGFDSRSHSISMTELETAQLWSARDISEKEQAGLIPKQ